jgi:hypothetical protein
MYNTGKVIFGIIIFILFFTIPIWLNFGKVSALPKPVVPKGKKCVEPVEYMRAYHMKLLDDWRLKAIRENKYIYINSRGERIRISLQKTCLKCHPSRKQFCDRCHKVVVTHPDCWECHIVPEEAKRWH